MPASVEKTSEIINIREIAETLPIKRPVRRGEPCPRCGIGRLDYNGLIDLECPVCGYSEGSGAGCT